MLKKVLILTGLLVVCSSCVSRTTYKKQELDSSKEVIEQKELIWFWDKDF